MGARARGRTSSSFTLTAHDLFGQDRVLSNWPTTRAFFNGSWSIMTQTHIMRFFNTPERSTFVAFRGTTEILRMSGVTSVEGVEAFLLRAMQ
jgi:hypothetical protein